MQRFRASICQVGYLSGTLRGSGRGSREVASPGWMAFLRLAQCWTRASSSHCHGVPMPRPPYARKCNQSWRSTNDAIKLIVATEKRDFAANASAQPHLAQIGMRWNLCNNQTARATESGTPRNLQNRINPRNPRRPQSQKSANSKQSRSSAK